MENNNMSYNNIEKDSKSNITLYNSLYRDRLVMGNNYDDIFNVYIYCVFKLISPGELNVFTFLSSRLPNLNEVSVSQKDLIILITLFPDYLNKKYKSNENSRVLTYSLVNFLEALPHLLNLMQVRNTSILFIFHGIA
jgi:hypothetical protein